MHSQSLTLACLPPEHACKHARWDAPPTYLMRRRSSTSCPLRALPGAATAAPPAEVLVRVTVGEKSLSSAAVARAAAPPAGGPVRCGAALLLLAADMLMWGAPCAAEGFKPAAVLAPGPPAGAAAVGIGGRARVNVFRTGATAEGAGMASFTALAGPAAWLLAGGAGTAAPLRARLCAAAGAGPAAAPRARRAALVAAAVPAAALLPLPAGTASTHVPCMMASRRTWRLPSCMHHRTTSRSDPAALGAHATCTPHVALGATVMAPEATVRRAGARASPLLEASWSYIVSSRLEPGSLSKLTVRTVSVALYS